jgi:hypothetical protein
MAEKTCFVASNLLVVRLAISALRSCGGRIFLYLKKLHHGRNSVGETICKVIGTSY